jgi:Family of unknown function (DUF6282)
MTIDELMLDAVDLHVHGAPEPIEGERRINILELAQQAKEAGMKGVVIKSTRFGTGSLATVINQLVKSPILIGSLVLNNDVGGLNPDVVQAHAAAGVKVIWLPTFSAEAHERTRGKGTIGIGEDGKDVKEGISIIDDDGKLVPQMEKILEIIKSNKLVLATGHVSKTEVFIVTKEALRQNINVIITHPIAGPAGPLLSIVEAKELAAMGAFIECTFAHCMPPMILSPEKMAGYIKMIGAEHCVLSTDFGQIFNPPPTEGFHMMLATMLQFSNLSENELKIMVKINPAKILGLT